MLVPLQRALRAQPIAWRPLIQHAVRLDHLRATFPNQQLSEMMDWLLEQDAVREAILERIEIDERVNGNGFLVEALCDEDD